MTTIISGDSGITFPNSTVQASAGQVLQVVQGSLTGQISTSGSTFVTTGLTASITPKFSTSKILAIVTANQVFTNANGASVYITLYRNGSNLQTGGSGVDKNFGQLFNTTNQPIANITFSYLDSPATTSSTTYTVYYAADSNTARINQNSSTSYIQLLEIAG